jgi:hypothetical protein
MGWVEAGEKEEKKREERKKRKERKKEHLTAPSHRPVPSTPATSRGKGQRTRMPKLGLYLQGL